MYYTPWRRDCGAAKLNLGERVLRNSDIDVSKEKAGISEHVSQQAVSLSCPPLTLRTRSFVLDRAKLGRILARQDVSANHLQQSGRHLEKGAKNAGE